MKLHEKKNDFTKVSKNLAKNLAQQIILLD